MQKAGKQKIINKKMFSLLIKSRKVKKQKVNDA